MRNRLSLVPVVAVGLMGAPTAASAAAWTLETGEGLAIVSATPSQAEQAFDANGKLQSIPRYNKAELQALIEYGLTNWFTLMLAPSLQHIDIGAPVDAQRSGLGYTDIGGRMRLLQADAWVFSLQTTLRVPGTFDKSNPAAIGYTDPEIDVRALVGYSFAIGGWPAFVDAQLAQRFRLGAPPDEFRADFSFGLRPHARWLLLAQSFNVVSEGAGTAGFTNYAYHKLQLSAVYAVTPAVSVQFGGYTTYAGRNALQENGLVLAGWYRF